AAAAPGAGGRDRPHGATRTRAPRRSARGGGGPGYLDLDGPTRPGRGRRLRPLVRYPRRCRSPRDGVSVRDHLGGRGTADWQLLLPPRLVRAFGARDRLDLAQSRVLADGSQPRREAADAL